MLNEIRFPISIPCEGAPSSIDFKSDELKEIFIQNVKTSWERCNCYVLGLVDNADGSQNIFDGREIYQYLSENIIENINKVSFYLLEKTDEVSQAIFKPIGDFDNLTYPLRDFLNLDPQSNDLSYFTSIHFHEKGDFSQAYECLNKAANEGSVESMYCLSVFLKSGKGVDKDLTKALDWLQKAAEAGHPESMYVIGCQQKEDPSKALYWLQKAAEAGHPKAMYAIGCQQKEDPSKALYWFQKAAEAGHPKAMYILGRLHYQLSINTDHMGLNPGLFGNAYLFTWVYRDYSEFNDMYNLCLKEGLVSAPEEKIDYLSEKVKAIYWLVHSVMKGHLEANQIIQKIKSQHNLYSIYLCNSKMISRVEEGYSIEQILKEQKDEALKVEQLQIELQSTLARLKEFKVKSEGAKAVSDEMNFIKSREPTKAEIEMDIEKEEINASLFYIARNYFYGDTFCQDYKKAFELLNLCLAYAPSYKLLGDCYRNGYSTKVNIVTAKGYYKLGALNGSVECMDSLNVLKIEVLRSKLTKTECKIEKEKINKAIFGIASLYLDGFNYGEHKYYKNYERAFEFLHCCEDYAPSLKLLGDCYRYGYSVDVDIEIAKAYYENAINKGCTESIFSLDDLRVKQLRSELAKAETEDNKKVINQLIYQIANYYLTGFTCCERAYPINYERAFEFLNYCEDYAPSLKLLGDCYRYGCSVDVDREKAKEFYEAAAEKGCEESIGCLYQLNNEEAEEEWLRARERPEPDSEPDAKRQKKE